MARTPGRFGALSDGSDIEDEDEDDDDEGDAVRAFELVLGEEG